MKGTRSMRWPPVIGVKIITSGGPGLQECTNCHSYTNVYFSCSMTQDPMIMAAMIAKKLGGKMCSDCFQNTPCGRGEHEHGECATQVWQ